MRKQVYGRQFKRDTNERKALFKGLVSSLVLREGIVTTEEKAKAVKPQAEKLVTTAKRGGLHAHSLLQPYLTAAALKKMLGDVAPRFTDRPGGYTRIIRLGRRQNDNASLVRLEWVIAPEKASRKVTAESMEEGMEEVQSTAPTKKAPRPAKKAATSEKKPAKKTAKKEKSTK